MTPEGAVKQKVKNLLDGYKPDCWYFLPAARAYGSAGVPDFIGVFMGRMFAVETKAGKNKPTTMQVRQMDRIRQAGGKVFVIYGTNVYELAEWLRNERGESLG